MSSWQVKCRHYLILGCAPHPGQRQRHAVESKCANPRAPCKQFCGQKSESERQNAQMHPDIHTANWWLCLLLSDKKYKFNFSYVVYTNLVLLVFCVIKSCFIIISIRHNHHFRQEWAKPNQQELREEYNLICVRDNLTRNVGRHLKWVPA